MAEWRGMGMVFWTWHSWPRFTHFPRDEPQAVRLKQRNFDPETRTLRKRDRTDALGDTVEKNVEGVAEQIIAEDAERRQQELVRTTLRIPLINKVRKLVH